MLRWVRWMVIGVVLAVFLGYMCTYTVRFTESAVKTRFGRADEMSVRHEPGLYWKWPFAERVTRYDTRVRFLESRPETQQTRDSRQVVVTAYMTYRVSDPLKFYQRFSGSGERAENHYDEAERWLRTSLRQAVGQLSRYRLEEILSPSADLSALAQIESAMFQAMNQGNVLADVGIEPVTVAVSSIRFPQDVTRAVFDAMRANRQRIANEAIAEGRSRAETIRKSAEADAQRIMAFADVLAKEIRNRGDNEAAQYIGQMNEDPQLAVFLKNMEFMRESIGRTTTLVLPTSMPGMEMFRLDAVDRIRSGQAWGPSLNPAQPQVPETTIAGPAGGAATPAQTEGQR